MNALVNIKWHWIAIDPTDTWSVTEKRIIESGAKIAKLERCVYVIRIASDFAIKYPRRYSPTIYIGEGSFKSRVTRHRKWLSALHDLSTKVPLEIAFCFPRVRGNVDAYKDYEAHLLARFFDTFGSLPLKNKIHENKKFSHIYEDSADTYILGPGKGRKYLWAIQPLKANSFYEVYHRTHEAS